MREPDRLRGRRALITGASGGIGSAVARAFAREGAELALTGRRLSALEALAGEIRQDGAPAHALVADLADASSSHNAVVRAAELLGGIDTIVTCAGVEGAAARIAQTSAQDWDQTIAVNLSGVFYVCRAALPLFDGTTGGTIVNITSVTAHKAWSNYGPLGAAKAGVELLTRVIAVEYADRGVRAVCLAPATVDTGMTESASPATREEWSGLQPLRRMGKPDEVAEAAVWLASDAASFVTGSTLFVDGGFMA